MGSSEKFSKPLTSDHNQDIKMKITFFFKTLYGIAESPIHASLTQLWCVCVCVVFFALLFCWRCVNWTPRKSSFSILNFNACNQSKNLQFNFSCGLMDNLSNSTCSHTDTKFPKSQTYASVYVPVNCFFFLSRFSSQIWKKFNVHML